MVDGVFRRVDLLDKRILMLQIFDEIYKSSSNSHSYGNLGARPSRYSREFIENEGNGKFAKIQGSCKFLLQYVSISVAIGMSAIKFHSGPKEFQIFITIHYLLPYSS